jgi:hypothetical protein
MARCDEGYLCQVCREEVEEIFDSSLYLMLVLGWIDPETLHTTPECHLRCNSALAQFIDDSRFQPPVEHLGPGGRSELDSSFFAQRSALVTAGYQRLWEIFNLEDRPDLLDYPLPEVRARWGR